MGEQPCTTFHAAHVMLGSQRTEAEFVLCCAVLCCDVLCCVVLSFAPTVLCYGMLSCQQGKWCCLVPKYTKTFRLTASLVEAAASRCCTITLPDAALVPCCIRTALVKNLLCLLCDVNSSCFLSCYLAPCSNNVNTSRFDTLHAAFPQLHLQNHCSSAAQWAADWRGDRHTMPSYTFLGQQMLTLCLQATVTASAAAAAAALAKAHGMLLLSSWHAAAAAAAAAAHGMLLLLLQMLSKTGHCD